MMNIMIITLVSLLFDIFVRMSCILAIRTYVATCVEVYM